MTKTNAQVRMKALVAARLLMGDFDDWWHFQKEREAASKIVNRRAARSVSSQMGRSYGDLSVETQRFISNNFSRCDYGDLAKLCDAVQIGHGIYQRLDEFEASFFPLAEQIRRRFPFHAHVSISLYGLQFEFPEHHFMRDMERGLTDLAETQSRIGEIRECGRVLKEQRAKVREIVGYEKFLSRSTISASFSLVEAFLSGLFFTAVHTNRIGDLQCDEEFLRYAQSKESAPLKNRLDKVLQFVSGGQLNGAAEPFSSFIDYGKGYRDAIHHTTPFQRRDVQSGGRLLMLYEIRSDVAVKCALYSSSAVLEISRRAFGDPDETAIAIACRNIKEQALRLLREGGEGSVSEGIG